MIYGICFFWTKKVAHNWGWFFFFVPVPSVLFCVAPFSIGVPFFVLPPALLLFAFVLLAELA